MNIYMDLLETASKDKPSFRGSGDFQRVAILETAYSLACSMLEGLLDPDPVVSETARLIYAKRLSESGEN